MNEFFPLASAAGMTVGLAVCALIVGLALAMFFAVWESAKWRPVAWAGSALVTILRGLPEILVVLFIYFGSSQLLLTLSDGFTINLGIVQIPVQMDIENFDVSPFLCGVIALSLLYAAYASQTLRGALKAVPVGQWESGQALGLSKSAIFFRLVMPQMWRHALPGLGNQWLVLLKDTALVSLISVNDLMLQTKSIATRTQEPFTWYIVAAAIYLVITLLSQYILKRIDLRADPVHRVGNLKGVPLCRALEHHVFDKVRDPVFLFRFKAGARSHDRPHTDGQEPVYFFDYQAQTARKLFVIRHFDFLRYVNYFSRGSL